MLPPIQVKPKLKPFLYAGIAISIGGIAAYFALPAGVAIVGVIAFFWGVVMLCLIGILNGE